MACSYTCKAFIMSCEVSVPGCAFYRGIGVVLITCSTHHVIGTFYQFEQSCSSEFIAFWSRRITFRGLGDIQANTPTLFPTALPSSNSALPLRWSTKQRFRFGPSLVLYPSALLLRL